MLETKIENLTKAIIALTEIMISAAQEMKDDASTIVEHSLKAEPDKTHDDLRDVILAANRKDAKNKATIKELLTKYDATKVTDVAQDKIAALLADIEKAIS